MRTALICHHDNLLNRDVLPRFLASFSTLAGVVVVRERPGRLARRLAFEWRRSRLRLLDVLAFRIVYRLVHRRSDRAWVSARAAELARRWPEPEDVPTLVTDDPNSSEVRAFLEERRPDLMIARCKTLLRPEVFEIPPAGTFVVHPGICPEYRNAHGCFWALARRDVGRVGATLLRIDEGVDTGPVFSYYTAPIDERAESHVVIQHRVVFENLDLIAADLKRIYSGEARPLDLAGRSSAAWGQPRLSDYLRWKWAAR